MLIVAGNQSGQVGVVLNGPGQPANLVKTGPKGDDSPTRNPPVSWLHADNPVEGSGHPDGTTGISTKRTKNVTSGNGSRRTT